MEKLDPRFYNRPSRFDLVVEVPLPSREDRLVYLKTVEPSFTQDDLDYIIKNTDDLSLAHMRELIVLTKIFGKPIDEALRRFENMKIKKSSSDFSSPVGFR